VLGGYLFGGAWLLLLTELHNRLLHPPARPRSAAVTKQPGRQSAALNRGAELSLRTTPGPRGVRGGRVRPAWRRSGHTASTSD
jgi:hypothetical protein